MNSVKPYALIIILLIISVLTNCGGSVGGTEYSDIDDGLSSDYFIKSLSVNAPALANPEDPNATKLTLEYDFSPSEWVNKLNVPNKIDKITVTAETVHGRAFMFINDIELENGKASAPIDLAEGVNEIRIKVIAQDGRELTYTIHVIRNSEAQEIATLKEIILPAGINLSPDFDPAGSNREFSTSVSSATISIAPAVSDTSKDATFKIIANDDEVSDPNAISLDGGANTIKIICTAGDGKTTDTYILNIIRKIPSPSVKLASLAIKNISFNEAFSPGTFAYTASVNAALNPISLIALTESTTASISAELNGNNVSNLESITLIEGNNTIIATITNGALSQDYTITATCTAASSNANFKSLKVTMGSGNRPIYPGNFIRGDANYHNAGVTKFTKTVYQYVTVIYGFRNITITAIVDDPATKSVQFRALKHDGITDAVSSQSYTNGVAVATIDLDIGYVTPIDITVTAGDETTKQTYHLDAKLLNSDEFHWGIYSPSFDKSKSFWPTPSGISDNTYQGKVSGSANWKTGLSNGTFQGESWGAKSEIIISNFNDGNADARYLMYNDGGVIVNGTQFTYLKSASSKYGWNISPNRYWVTTATGDNIADYYYHLKVTNSLPVQQDNGVTNPANQSYTDVKYMGSTEWERVFFKTVKPYPFTDNNWFEPWSDKQGPNGVIIPY